MINKLTYWYIYKSINDIKNSDKITIYYLEKHDYIKKINSDNYW